MFGRKKQQPVIDKTQLELIENAQRRIKQKKRLYAHFVLFLVGCLVMVIANKVLAIGDTLTFAGYNWLVYAIAGWGLLFLYHVFTVFITQRFMGKAWEQQQLEKLVSQQQTRIAELKDELKKEERIKAKSAVFNENTSVTPPVIAPKTTLFTLIVAVAENNAIGKDNKLIWHLSKDLKRFKALTSGHHIIMGRKTFESFPKPLPNRTHVVITRQKDYQVPDGIIVVNSLEAAMAASTADTQPFIIGGAQIYEQALAIADTIELTRVHHDFEADAFFPDLDPTVWKEVHNEFHTKDANHAYEFSFITYKRL
jgi:dihydrofolate reductase